MRLAREYDALIVTDDVYDFLQWPSSLTAESLSVRTAILPRIVDVDRFLDGGAEREGADGFGNAASNGSFSKICGPGLRTGWCEGTAKLAYGVSQTYVFLEPCPHHRIDWPLPQSALFLYDSCDDQVTRLRGSQVRGLIS